MKELRQLLGNKFFGCTFQRNDGTIKTGVFRMNVKQWKTLTGERKKLVGVKMNDNPTIIRALCMKDKNWNTIHIERMIEIKQSNFHFQNKKFITL